MWRVKIIIFGGILAFLIFLVILWLFLNNPTFANTPFSIGVARFYVFKIIPAFNLEPNSLHFDVTPIQIVHREKYRTYLYLTHGTFEKIDFEKKFIYFQSKSGNRYRFKFVSTANVLTYYEQFSRTQTPIKKEFAFSNNTNQFPESPFKPDDELVFQWEDERTLSDILKGANNEIGTYLNLDLGDSNFQLIGKISE